MDNQSVLNRLIRVSQQSKRKKTVHRKRLEKERQQKYENSVRSSNKKYAVDLWNEKPKSMETWKKQWEPGNITKEEVNKLYSKATTAELRKEYAAHVGVSIEDFEQLSGTIYFFSCLEFCSNWLLKKLSLLGFKKNVTGYDPIDVSHSMAELLEASTECYKMMLKQILWMIEDN
jgi:hypothetical protein